MARPVSNVVKTSLVHAKQKNGDIYVLERKTIYDPEKHYTKSLGTRLIGKIPFGQTEMVPTRPRKKKAEVDGEKEKVTASRKRAGLTEILKWIGQASGIDEDLSNAGDQESVQTALTLAHYFFATEAQSLTHLEKWQFTHETPSVDGLSESTCNRFFAELGRNEGVMQHFFEQRACRLDQSPSIAFDSTTVSAYSRDPIDASPGFDRLGDGLHTIKLLTLYSVDTHQPIAFRTQSSHLPAVTGVTNALKELTFLDLKHPLVVTDNGCYNEGGIADFSRSHTKFLTPGHLDNDWIHRVLEIHREELETASSICPWDLTIHGITVPVDHDIERMRKRQSVNAKKGELTKETHHYYLHFFLNRENVARDEHRLMSMIMELRSLLLAGEELTESAREKADKYLITHRKGRGGLLHVDFNEETIREARKDDGYFVLVSNKAMDAFEALKTYRLREQIEETFKVREDRPDGTRTRVWYSDNLRGRLFVQFIALGYYCFFRNKINELKATLGTPNGDPDHDKKGNLDKELGLKRWLEQHSIAQILDWFDCYEDARLSTPPATARWTTENTERDRLFLAKLGMLDELA